MKVFAISDLHLSLTAPFDVNSEMICMEKPMDVFGSGWGNHGRRLYDNWLATVSEEDTVLMAGDTSWGMKLADCRYDFDFLGHLPGRIILSRGNHDYWWEGIGNVRKALPANVIPINHDSVVVGSRVGCATRGWLLPGSNDWKKEDEKIYQRELLRLEMALQDGASKGLPLVVMLHYPPFSRQKMAQESGFWQLMRRYEVGQCIYGHLHGEECARLIEGEFDGISLVNSSSDCLGFMPRLIWEE